MSKYVQNYSEIKKNGKFSFREKLRGLVLDGLALKDRIADTTDLLKKPRIQFLYIHHTYDDEIKPLDRLLKKLGEHHSFISHSEAVAMLLQGKIDKPYISISTDDGFKNNMNAATVLNDYSIKGCFFINPGLIGETDYEVIKKHCAERLHIPPVQFLDWDEVNELQRQGHEIGGHTMYHINVADTPATALKEDMEQTVTAITKHCGEVKHFAYPYGLYHHFNEAGRKAVFDAGYTSCSAAERGCHINHDTTLSYDQLFIRRDHVVLDWDLYHIMYFIANNAKNASVKGNLFPY